MPNSKPVRLIKSKISRPQVRSDIVPRQRLTEQLSGGLTHPLSLVCAGAGFGKTTFVSAWIDELVTQKGSDSAPLVAWLSLDEHDSDLNQFLRYFIAAIREVVPMACGQTLALLGQWSEPPLTVLVPVLCDDILSLPCSIVVVLDDYHSIRGTAVHDLLNELLRYWPEPLHLVIVTRFTPPLPIAGLRAKRNVTEIRNYELRFTVEEVAEYVRRMWSTPLSPTGLELLVQKTEGWVASLQLATLSLRTADNVDAVLDSLSGTNADIAEYLADEVLSNLPPTFYTFLLKISILNRFNVALSEAVAADEDPELEVRAILDHFVQSNLFIVPLDNRQEWYRFHHLFRDLLRQRLLTAFSEDEIADLHRKAALWHAQEGLVDIALYHALQAADLEMTADIMEQNLCDVLNREDFLSLERWLRMLPEKTIDNRPSLLVLKGWYLSYAWHIDGVSQVVQRAEALLDQRDAAALEKEPDQIVRGQIAVLKSQAAFHQGQPALGITYAQDALALLPSTWQYARGGVMSYLALSMQATGQESAAEDMLLERYESLIDKTSNYAMRLLFTLSLISVQSGKLEQAEQTATRLLQQATTAGSIILEGWAHLILGLVHYEWNHLDLAEQHFGALLTKRQSLNSLVARQGNAGAILVQLAAGHHAEAMDIVIALSQFDMALTGHIDDLTQALRAQIWVATDNIDEAGRWADTFTEPLAPLLFILLDLPQVIKAQILLARGGEADLTLTMQIVQGMLLTAEQTHNLRRKIEVLALSALVLHVLEDKAAAEVALKQAIALGCAGGFVRAFVDLGPRMQMLLAGLTVPEAYVKYKRRILRAFGSEVSAETQIQPPPETPSLVEPLTMREMEVLTLLREPISAREIALKLDISHSTVKRHTINIYGKLGVHSRWDAVARAEANGILSHR